MDWAGVLAFIAAVGHSIGRSPLKRGRRGIEVKVVQQRLNALDFWCGTADGVFGRKTTKAVRQLQRTALRDTTGIVTGNLWAIMCDPEVPRGL
jgi:peptidoglycan hydrolase-like protein with peptidoglycan-binding domain